MGETQSMEEIWRKSQLNLVVYPIIYRVLYIPGGFLAGFLNHPTLGVVCFSAASYEKKQPAAEILFRVGS